MRGASVRRIALALIVVAAAACTTAAPPSTRAPAPSPGESQRGRASWYGTRFQGRKTANGERFDRHAMTAAHRTLRFGTRVRVTNLDNGRHVVVRVNDRGPYGAGRIIDLSEAAARALDMIDAGVVDVRLDILEIPARPERAR